MSPFQSLLVLWSLVTTIVACQEFVRTEPLPLIDQLFPNQSLDEAWERHPLLSRVSSDDKTCGNSTIPSVFIPRNDKKALSRQERLDFVDSLMTTNTLGDIVNRFHRLNYEYGSDYKIKRAQGNITIDYFENTTDAEEKKLESWEDAIKIVDEGYSLIVDGLHMIYSPIARMTRMLEQESGCNYATCNLYYTPPNSAGFSPHYDWMDVIVVQVAGIKRWSVASEPCVYLSNNYQTRYKMRPDIPRYEDFIMYPGDVLYIPRGVTHNATTPLNSEEPSLHLTFGIEHQWFTTFEALIHHTLNLYAKNADGFTVTPSGEECDVDWSQFLHYTISEITRIEDGPDACYLMRESLPRHSAWKQVYSNRRNGAPFEEAFAQDFTKILDTILDLANATETLTFFQELKYFGSDGSYAFVGIHEDDVEENVACFQDAQVDEVQFSTIVKEFVAFAKENQAAALESLEKHQARKQWKARTDDNYWLVENWGHSAECNDKHPLALRYGNESVDCQS